MELAGLALKDLADIGGWTFGLVVLIVVTRMIFTGQLVTRREADNIVGERDAWRKVAETYGEQLGVIADQGADIVRAQQTFETFVRALPHPQQRRTGGR